MFRARFPRHDVPRALLLGIMLWFVTCVSDATKEKTKTDTCSGADNGQECVGDANEYLKEELDEEKEDYPCTFYLAESSIPNAGLGTYTAIPLQKGETLDSGPIIAHIDAAREDRDHGDYFWDEAFFPYPLFDTHFPSNFLEFGATNSHPTLSNIESSLEDFQRDSAGLHRFKDSGTGAFTSYNGLKWKATHNIKAGSELFVDIGEGYFAYREEKIGYVPRESDYELADQILLDALQAKRKEKEYWTEETYREFLIFVDKETNEHIRALLPSDSNDLERAVEMGSAKFNLPNNIKTPEWLKENGWCLDDDKVEKRISLIPQAGRGLFANRSIKKGSTVAPSPVIIFERDLMDIYDSYFDEDTGDIVYEYNNVLGKQMILNYCYSHRESTVLIIPNNDIVHYINHNGNDPNTKVRWIDSYNMKPEDWLSKSPEELFEIGSGPMMEFYAIRDIKPGEEITLDYGPEWDAAWTNHVNSWVPDGSMKDYISADDYIEEGLFTVRTITEQEEDPYPGNLHTACYFTPHDFADDDDDDDSVELEEGDEVDWNVSAHRVTNNGEEFQCLFICDILSTQEQHGVKYFEALLHEYENSSFLSYSDEGEPCHIPGHVFVVGMPLEAITLIDLPYTSDEHIEGAFRHEIGVPEGFFPPNWLDIPKREK